MTLWKVNREVVWALNSVMRFNRGQRQRPKSGHTYKVGGYDLVVRNVRYRWGNSLNARMRGPVSHIPDYMMLASKDGVFVGRQVRWICGQMTTEFTFTRTAKHRICVACWARTAAARVALEAVRKEQINR